MRTFGPSGGRGTCPGGEAVSQYCCWTTCVAVRVGRGGGTGVAVGGTAVAVAGTDVRVGGTGVGVGGTLVGAGGTGVRVGGASDASGTGVGATGAAATVQPVRSNTATPRAAKCTPAIYKDCACAGRNKRATLQARGPHGSGAGDEVHLRLGRGSFVSR